MAKAERSTGKKGNAASERCRHQEVERDATCVRNDTTAHGGNVAKRHANLAQVVRDEQLAIGQSNALESPTEEERESSSGNPNSDEYEASSRRSRVRHAADPDGGGME